MHDPSTGENSHYSIWEEFTHKVTSEDSRTSRVHKVPNQCPGAATPFCASVSGSSGKIRLQLIRKNNPNPDKPQKTREKNEPFNDIIQVRKVAEAPLVHTKGGSPFSAFRSDSGTSAVHLQNLL